MRPSLLQNLTVHDEHDKPIWHKSLQNSTFNKIQYYKEIKKKVKIDEETHPIQHSMQP